MRYDIILHIDFDSSEALRLGFHQAFNYRKEAQLHKHGLTAQDIAERAGFVSLEDVDTFRVVMVVNGPAVHQLVKENEALYAEAKEAVAGGLTILAGACAMEDYGVEAGELWDIVEVVPSVTLEIVKLQHEGYTYIKV